MTHASNDLILYEIFRTLRERHVPLGVPDYLDGLRALRLGFGGSGREGLHTLCRSLWARSDDERRLVDALFDKIPRATREELDELSRRLPQPKQSSREQHFAPPAEDSRASVPPPGDQESEGAEEPPRVGISFTPPRQPGGIPLPHLAVPAGVQGETYVLEPQTIVSPRSLAVLWRRFRALRRSGPKTVLDVQATVEERCRQGVVATPILRPARLNTARLLVLADTSPSMDPWMPFLDAMSRSLALSRLKAAAIYYFSNVPRRSLFRTRVLTDAAPLSEVLKRHQGAGLLVISDAGAARGVLSPRRVSRTETFLREARIMLRPVVWINPMPHSRWEQTTAGMLSRSGAAVFLPLNEPSLIKAIDVLRGTRLR